MLKYVSFLLGGVSAAATALYLFVYLYRWQWNRALICGVLLIAIEVLLLGAIILTRLNRLERTIAADDGRSEDVRRRLRQSRDHAYEESPHAFRWIDAAHLGDQGARHVFIPVLLGLGVVLSALSWIVQRAARLTVGPTSDKRLSRRLAPLGAPAVSTGPGSGARSGPHTASQLGPQLEDEPPVPAPRPVRTFAIGAAVVALIVGAAASIDALGDATQTRREGIPDSAATTLVMRVETKWASGDAANENAAISLWEKCRHGVTAAPLDNADMSRLSTDVFAIVVRPALTDNDLARLRGCLADANTGGVQADIIGEGQASAPPWLP
ncbi:MAG TPA: hypothetical protein VLH10_20050 [Yinghuangia sp.]|nr:hypothetical protein [Yinghuangia sp.]